jgi:hypothetical protein
MDRGPDFLKSQINNAVMQHQTFLKNLEDHESQAEDPRFRNLCSKHIPRMREHQRMLEGLQQAVGAELGAGKKALGAALGIARDLADSVRESDFLRLVGDIVTARQSQDTAYTFSEAGRMLGHAQLQQVGETLHGHHKDYVDEANRLAVQMFVEHTRGTDPTMSTGVGTGASSASTSL